MSELAKKKRLPGKAHAPVSKDRNKDRKKSQPVTEQASDSDDIERAVYDGMQDLRVEKPK